MLTLSEFIAVLSLCTCLMSLNKTNLKLPLDKIKYLC